MSTPFAASKKLRSAGFSFGVGAARLGALVAHFKNRRRTLDETVADLLSRVDGSPDGLTHAAIELVGVDTYSAQLAQQLGIDGAGLAPVLMQTIQAQQNVLLTGAELIALVLLDQGVTHAVGYPGTSELALCDAISRLQQPSLINGRGDAECVFIASGGSLLSPAHAVAILHGGRGGTNALGAVAMARRNEIGMVCLVGMPSRYSQGFLPPHAEVGLIEGLSHFAKTGWEAPGPGSPSTIEGQLEAGQRLLESLLAAFESARALPAGPVIVGVPQDIAEGAWIPLEVWRGRPTQAESSLASVDQSSLSAAIDRISSSKRPLLLIDDPIFRFQGVKQVLSDLCFRTGGQIMQIAYRRGPMLFKQFSPETDACYLGLFDRADASHVSVLESADLIITVEDRNMYPRVVGCLPDVPKIAINSHSAMVEKNGYLRDSDVLLAGNPFEILQIILANLAPPSSAATPTVVHAPQRTQQTKFEFLRVIVPRELGKALARQRAPILFDDSQMFGGVISAQYSHLPDDARVFGDHSGFVGGGIGLAVGAALQVAGSAVWCLVGDQAFTNGCQALVCAGEQKLNVKILLCDNGESVSLLKQSRYEGFAFEGMAQNFLRNPSSLDYVSLARAMGLTTFDLSYDPDSTDSNERDPTASYQAALNSASEMKGPVLIRLRVPSDPIAWEGIWAVRGLDAR